MKSCGAVLGIDTGWSVKRKSSAICRLHWLRDRVDWEICRFRATDDERNNAILHVAASSDLKAVAIDGPLRRDFDAIRKYRSAERLLSRGDIPRRIGKPGQANAPNGIKLNRQANLAARSVKKQCRVRAAPKPIRIDSCAIFEAFPTTFLGLMIDRPEALSKPKARSDRYFRYLADNGDLERFLADLLPGRRPVQPLCTIRNHDDRAALVCALTALCVAAGDFTAVGDDNDGWIILPPKRHYADWSWKALCQQAASDKEGGELRIEPESSKNHRGEPLLIHDSQPSRRRG